MKFQFFNKWINHTTRYLICAFNYLCVMRPLKAISLPNTISQSRYLIMNCTFQIKRNKTDLNLKT